jgi:hypothetical protein
MPDPAAMEPLLIPNPQSVKLTGRRAPIGDLNGKRNRIGYLQMEEVADARGVYRPRSFRTPEPSPQIHLQASSRLHASALTTLSQLS